MKKSSLTAMILGTISGFFVSLGMCMVLISEWNSFRPGIAVGCAGMLLAIVTILVWRKMEHKHPVCISARAIAVIVSGITGTLVLGTGMCFSMIWDRMIPGIIIGIAGIMILLNLIPCIRGIKK